VSSSRLGSRYEASRAAQQRRKFGGGPESPAHSFAASLGRSVAGVVLAENELVEVGVDLDLVVEECLQIGAEADQEDD
jgi:hypothetical protein